MFFLTNDRLIRHCMEREVGKGREREKKKQQKDIPQTTFRTSANITTNPGMETVDSGYKIPVVP